MKQLLFIIFSTFFLFACTSKRSEPIYFGKEACHHCKMTISDHRFGGELVNPKGKVFKFDSLECMKEFKDKHIDEYKEYVVDISNKGELIEAEKAYFIINNNLRSPMGGLGILASENENYLINLMNQKNDEKSTHSTQYKKNLDLKNSDSKENQILRWNTVYNMLKR